MRKTFSVILALILSSLLLVSIASANTSDSQSVEQSARNALTAFLDAEKNHDFDAIVDNSIDNRPGETLSERRKIFEDEGKSFLGYNILSVQKVDDTHAIASATIYLDKSLKNSKHELTFEYPVVFNGTKWIVDVTYAHESNNTSALTKPSSNGKSGVKPADYPVQQYGGTLYGITGDMHFLSSGFNVWSNTVHVTGWQVMSSGVANVDYEIDKSTTYGLVTIAAPQNVSGNYPTDSWFPQLHFYNVPAVKAYVYGTWNHGWTTSTLSYGGNIYSP